MNGSRRFKTNLLSSQSSLTKKFKENVLYPKFSMENTIEPKIAEHFKTKFEDILNRPP